MSDDIGFDPVPGRPDRIAPGLRRVLAPNPSPMTWRGTNTYLLGRTEIAVIDPGPALEAHLAAILAAIEPGRRITHIFVTHAHLDHSPLARPLAARTGAKVHAFGDATAGRSAVMTRLAADGLIAGGEGVDRDFIPDIRLRDKDAVEGPDWRLEALWTPGHFGNHLCFAWGDAIFSGDHVMGWASSLVSPPDGDLTDFMASCRRLATRRPARLLPGHGAPVEDPAARIAWLISHRETREAEIRAHLARAPATAAEIAAAIYTDTPASLLPAATRNVLAHLVDLTGKGATQADGQLGANATFYATAGK
ncbi:MBL fold metallo-hydrolase [Roseovarius spongiae]|uniref:MBL fold metallo-hydrolase n=1 Tax=Roseovarius spongiae TaxID=2320272 RepID=A0A3A8B6P4_9RHOB|nr:MBL fold metallo-hydrolase [Roseovarius spongiae]RKF16915.1 MBL fold metallo-hydrolase [Roseovarius spongiae]